MKLAIMQPYYLSYLGYWQLLNAVDKFIIYDDVNFIKGGWINRNRILVSGHPKYLNIPMLGASSFKLINEIVVNNDLKLIEKNLCIIEDAYKKAPYYDTIYPLIRKILFCCKDDIVSYITYSLIVICDYLDIKTELIISSSIEKDCSLKGQDKVLSICSILGATEYYNAIGGQELYSFSDFKDKGIKLNYLKTDAIEYRQFDNEFQPNLSILDVIMFNSKDAVKKLLNAYTLIQSDGSDKPNTET